MADREKTVLPEWVGSLNILEKDVTPGPWTFGEHSSVNHNLWAGEVLIAGVNFLGEKRRFSNADIANASFIAASREAVPRLIHEYSAALKRIQELEYQLATVLDRESATTRRYDDRLEAAFPEKN